MAVHHGLVCAWKSQQSTLAYYLYVREDECFKNGGLTTASGHEGRQPRPEEPSAQRSQEHFWNIILRPTSSIPSKLPERKATNVC